MADILDSIRKGDLTIFNRDFTKLIKIAAGMEINYFESNADFDLFMPRYEELIKLFNKKYKGLHLEIKKSTNQLRLRILFRNEKNIRDLFINAAIKILGIKSIGATRLGAADIDSPNFNKELDKIKDKAQISYYDSYLGSTTVFLEYDKKAKMVELRYSYDTILDTREPEFKLCAFYALSQGCDKKIDLLQKEVEFAFNDWSEETKKKYLDKFHPKLYE